MHMPTPARPPPPLSPAARRIARPSSPPLLPPHCAHSPSTISCCRYSPCRPRPRRRTPTSHGSSSARAARSRRPPRWQARYPARSTRRATPRSAEGGLPSMTPRTCRPRRACGGGGDYAAVRPLEREGGGLRAGSSPCLQWRRLRGPEASRERERGQTCPSRVSSRRAISHLRYVCVAGDVGAGV